MPKLGGLLCRESPLCLAHVLRPGIGLARGDVVSVRRLTLGFPLFCEAVPTAAIAAEKELVGSFWAKARKGLLMATTHKRLSVILGMGVVAIATALSVTPAFAASIDDPDYSLSTYSTGNLDQHVVLTVDYGSAVAVEDTTQTAVFGTNDLAITIAGRDITSTSYYRPVTISASGNTLVFDIGNCVSNGTASFTAQYNGIITAVGTPQGVTAGGEAVGALDIENVIPTGVALTTTGEGTSSLSATVSHVANVRGMVHIGIYEKNASGKLVPISTTAGTIGCYTYTIHAHSFVTMAASDYAASMASLSLPSGYSISASGDTVTLTSSDSSSQLYMYIFDADSLSSLNTDFKTLVDTGTGELNPDGTPAE